MRQKGFTLLELLISITILGLIAVILFGAMRLGMRSVDSGEKKIERLERARASMRIINSQIQSLMPLTYTKDTSNKYLFTGGSDTIQFPTSFSVLGKQRGYVLATYKVVQGENNTKALHITESQLIGGSEEIIDLLEKVEAVKKEDTVKLLEGFNDISFKFFFKDPTEETGKWIESWDEEKNIPEKIQLNLSGEKIDLALIIPVRVGAFVKPLQQVVSNPKAGAPVQAPGKRKP